MEETEPYGTDAKTDKMAATKPSLEHAQKCFCYGNFLGTWVSPRKQNQNWGIPESGYKSSQQPGSGLIPF